MRFESVGRASKSFDPAAISRRARSLRLVVLFLGLVLSLGLALPLQAAPQGQEPNPQGDAEKPGLTKEQCSPLVKKKVHISLDSTGVGTHAATNPRKPYPLLQPASRNIRSVDDSCYKYLANTALVFDNLTDRFIGVQLNINLKMGSQWSSQLRDLRLKLESQAISQKVKALQKKVEGAPPQPPSAGEEEKEGTEAQLNAAKGWIEQCQIELKEFDFAKSTLGSCTSIGASQKAAFSAFSSGEDPENLTKDLEGLINEIKNFSDRLADLKRLADGSSEGGIAKLCKFDDSAKVVQCTPKIVVLPNSSSQPIPGGILDLLDKKNATFTVSFENSADIPSNSTGYLKTSKDFQEQPDSTKWQVAAQIGAAWDPETKNKFFTTSSPFADKKIQHFAGAGSFKLDQRLGNRAAATATLGFKQGDLGESDSSNTVKVSEYRVQLYGDNEMQLLFGKYTLAAPSDGISANVMGEGVELQYRSLSLGHLIRRESESGVADSFNRDHRLFLAQVKNAAFPSALQPFRTGSFIALYGQEDNASLSLSDTDHSVTIPTHCMQPARPTDPSDPKIPENLCYAYRYWTVGGEVLLSHAFSGDSVSGSDLEVDSLEIPRSSLSGSMALYYNKRDLDQLAAERTGNRVRDGKGATGLFKLNYSQYLKDGSLPNGKPKYTWGAQLGYGSRGDAKDKVDHSYVGDTASFSPDLIFISRFAGSVGTLVGPLNEKAVAVGPGLSNKTYVNGNLTWNTWSPLAAIAKGLKINEAPNSQSMTFKLHYYRFNEPRFSSHEAGWEADVNFSVEVPKGVTTTLDFGYFNPGNALPEIPKNVWRIGAAVKATI